MTLKIPVNFNVLSQELDRNETFIRDELKLQIENWARFRYTIHIGNNADNLYSSNPIPEEVKAAYIELAKSHYEVVTSLGSARLALIDASLSQYENLLRFRKSLKDFYFHIGCLLDNLARLIYIINDSKSATEKTRRGFLKRHRIDWGSLRDYPGYTRLKHSKRLKEIRKIRNNITHSWSCPIEINNNVFRWPLAARTKHDYLWKYDERLVMHRKYRRWLPLLPMMRDDFKFIEDFQDTIFGKLVRDVRKFEKNYGVEIQ